MLTCSEVPEMENRRAPWLEALLLRAPHLEPDVDVQAHMTRMLTSMNASSAQHTARPRALLTRRLP